MTDLLVGHDFPPLGGGIARWMAEFAGRAGVVVSTGAMPGAADARFPGGVDRLPIASHRLKTLPARWLWRIRVSRLIARHRPGFVWAGDLRPAAGVALAAARPDRIPVGVMIHGGDLLQLAERYRRNPRRRRLARRLLGEPAALIANSRFTADLAREVAGRFDTDVADRLTVVPLGSDPTVFRPERRHEADLRRWGLPAGRRWLLTVARLVPHKGIDRGIETVAALRHLYPELGYLVVGEGPDRDRLRQLADRLEVADRVHLIGGVADAELPPLHAMADVYLGLSREEGLDVEGFGISLVDAAASGVPVVAGHSGGTTDAVDHGTTGVLVPPEDVAAAAAAVDQLLGDPDRRREMGEAGRQWVVSDRNWGRVTRDLAAVRRDALARPR